MGKAKDQDIERFSSSELLERISELEADVKRRDEYQSILVEGISSATGEDFFRHIIRYLSKVFNASYAVVGELSDFGTSVHTIAVWTGDGFGDNFEYSLKDTPCDDVMDGDACYYSSGIREEFPRGSVA